MWFELRWGITACLMLTVGLITRDLLQPSVDDERDAVLPDYPRHLRDDGRVAQVHVGFSGSGGEGRADLQAGQQRAGGRRRDAPGERSPKSKHRVIVAQSEIATDEGKI